MNNLTLGILAVVTADTTAAHLSGGFSSDKERQRTDETVKHTHSTVCIIGVVKGNSTAMATSPVSHHAG